MNAPIALADFRGRVVTLYRSLGRDAGTVQKMDQVLGELLDTLGRDASTADLTTDAVARWRALFAPQRAPWTVIGQLGYLRAACSYAAEEGWLERPPSWRRLRPARPKPGRGLRHTRAELARLLEDLGRRALEGGRRDRRLHALVATAAYTGLRRDELLYLRRADVLLEERVIELVPIAERALKTGESEQPVPVAPELAPILAGWIPEAAAFAGDRPWLWPGERTRGPWHGGGPGRRPIDHLRRAAIAVGIPAITWQSIRRSWATQAEGWGLTDSQIQRVLRHTSPLTSRLHYRGPDLEVLRTIAARISYRP